MKIDSNLIILGIQYHTDGGSVEFSVINDSTQESMKIILDNREQSCYRGQVFKCGIAFDNLINLDRDEIVYLTKALEIFKRTNDLIAKDLLKSVD
jgi:hypothetical protein